MGRVALKAFALLLFARALSNFRKPFADTVGFVFFGVVLEGLPNLILSPLFGIYMLVTGWAIWTRHRLALPLAIGYAAYVSISIPLFHLFNPTGGSFTLVFTIAVIALPWGAVWLLQRERAGG
jgi:hypothetical protein